MTITDPHSERRTYPNVPLPAGAEWDNEWCDDDPPYQSYRIIHGRTRSVGDPVEHFNGQVTGLAEVETSANQLIDGALEVDDPPQIHVQVYRDSGLNSVQARAVAALLVEAADEVDGWVTQ